jgi:PAS domain S-box-containing protein
MANRAIQHLFSYTEDDLLEHPLAELFADSELVEEKIFSTVSTGNINRFEADIVNKEGTIRNASSSIAALKDHHGDTLGVVVVITDLTEKKRYEEHLHRSARLASVGELAAGLAHEINNILAVIQGFTEVLLREVEDHDQMANDLKIMKREAYRGQELLKRLLIFARPAEPHMTCNDLHEIIDNSLLLLQYEIKQNKVSIEKNYSPDMPLVLSDSEQLKQVFMNIVLNAAQEQPEGGNITISSRVTEDRYAEVELKDSGPGIPAADLSKVFDPFFTTKAPGKGTGLGLSIAHRIVDNHGGWISVSRVPSGGTVFTIRLPINGKSDIEDTPSKATEDHHTSSGDWPVEERDRAKEKDHA